MTYKKTKNKLSVEGDKIHPIPRLMITFMISADAKRRLTDWFCQWRMPLRRFLMGRAGVSAADVDDVAQEVFLRLWRYDKDELIEHPQAYLYKVGLNVAAEWSFRAHNRQPHAERWLAHLIVREQPEFPLERAEAVDEVGQALEQLTPYQRKVLTLFLIEEKTYTQIAAELGESVRSITRQLRTSYRKLRGQLDPQLLGVITNGRD